MIIQIIPKHGDSSSGIVNIKLIKQMKPVRERLRRAEKILKKSPHLYELLKQEHELERKARARYLDRSR